jgi:Mce-associated membrane protein
MKKTSRLTTLILGVLVIGLAVAVAWVGVIVLQKKSDADQRAKAVQAARQMGVNLMTVDHASAQKDLDRMLAGTTGDLKNQLATQSKVFIDSVTKAQTKSTVSQVDAAVVSIDGDSAEVMVSLNGMVTNPKVPGGVTRPYRYLMDLTKSGDRWLVSKLEMVP